MQRKILALAAAGALGAAMTTGAMDGCGEAERIRVRGHVVDAPVRDHGRRREW